MEIKIAQPKAGAYRFTACVFDGSKILFPFTFALNADVKGMEAACYGQAKSRKIRISLTSADFLVAFRQAQANRPAAAQPVEITLEEQRRKLVWAINDAEQAILEVRERAFQRDMGSIPAGSTQLANARKALETFDAIHPQLAPSAEAIFNL